MYEIIGFDLSNFFLFHKMKLGHFMIWHNFYVTLLFRPFWGLFLGHPISLHNLFCTLTLLNVLSTTFFLYKIQNITLEH